MGLVFFGYIALIWYAKSDAAKEWFVLIASRSVGAKVEVERLSFRLPATLMAYEVKCGGFELRSLSLQVNPVELLGPTQTVTGRGELKEGLAFRYNFKGSFWTEELRALSVGIDQWPVVMLFNKIGLTKYLLAPPDQGRIKGVAYKKRQGWDFKGKIEDASIDLTRIAAGTKLPRNFPERSRVATNEIDLRYTKDEIKFNKPLHLKSRLGSIYLDGKLTKGRTWEWDVNASVKDALVARYAYGYLLRCQSFPEADVFRIAGPVQSPKCQ